MAPVAKSAKGARPVTKYRQLKSQGTGLTREEVANHQRARMFAAMIEAVAERGYTATSMRRLCALAGVSSEAIYQQFPSKEAYFLATFDVIALRAITRVRAAYHGEPHWTRQLHAAFAAFASEVVEQPAGARVALVEALGAGPAALSHLERRSAEFERMIQASFEKAPDGVSAPPLIVRGIVGGISRVTRQLLTDRREGELPGLADTLVEWALAYRSPAAAALRAPVPPRATTRLADLGTSEHPDEHTRILRAVARLAAEKGFTTLSIAQITAEAGVSDDAFSERYETNEDCFLAAYDMMGARVLAGGARAARDGVDWPDSILAGTRAVMRGVAADPAFARCAFIEVFALGPIGIDRRSRLMDSFAALLMSHVPSSERPSENLAEAIVGAVWQIAHTCVAHDRTDRLADIADYACYLVLAPIIGAEAAMERILEHDQSSAGGAERD